MEDKAVEQMMTKLQKELRFTRVVCMILSFLMLCVLVGGVIGYKNLQQVVKDVEPVMATVSELDVEALNAAIKELDTRELSQTLTNLNDAVNSLQEMREKVMSLFPIFDKQDRSDENNESA